MSVQRLITKDNSMPTMSVPKLKWSSTEDSMLISMIDKVGHNWKVVATNLSNRTPDSARNRWESDISLPRVARSKVCYRSWTVHEDNIVRIGVCLHGYKWRAIASMLTGRTDSSVRNRWNRMCKVDEKTLPTFAEVDELLNQLEE